MFVHFHVALSALLTVVCIICISENSSAKFVNEFSPKSHIPSKVVGLSYSQKPPVLLAQKKKKKRGKGKKGGFRKKKSMTGIDSETCSTCASLEGFVQPQNITDAIRRLVGKYKGGGGSLNVEIQRRRGIIETGLYPKFIDGAKCPEIDSEKWAIDYTYKRGRAALHRGVDIPQPRGTPIRAVSDGTVVGRFLNEGRKDGIAVFIRHNPQQTGLPFWTYSHYTHLLEMSPLPIGSKVKMGDEIGKTSNSGKMGKRVRRDALHFAIFYSKFPEWSNDGSVVIPRDGYAMDPNAFYRTNPPYDSQSMLELAGDKKGIPVPYMKMDYTFLPPDTKRIWPYPCL